MITDILGREIKVGDIVVATNNSTICNQIHVVTRLGSDDKVQVNGSSYCTAEYLMVCTEQYTHQKGQEAAANLVAEYAQHINIEPVQKKPKSPKFLVLRISDYGKFDRATYTTIEDPNPRFFVISTGQTTDDTYRKLYDIYEKDGRQYSSKQTLLIRDGKNPEFHYDSINHAVSKKALIAVGINLEDYIDQEIPSDSETYAKLKAIRPY